MNEQTQSKQPWYKVPFVWLVIAIPFSSVIGGIYLVNIATSDPNDVIKDNYYKEGLAINQRFAEDEQAKKLDLEATVSVQNDQIKVKLLGPELPFLKFNLYHVKNSDLDINGALAKTTSSDGETVYVYQFKDTPKGRWYIELSGDSGPATQVWRLKGRLDLPLSGQVTLLPSVN